MATLYVQRFRTIGDHRADALQLGLAKNPAYDLDFALGLVEEAERLYAAKQGGARVVADDPFKRTQEAYFEKFATWARIHPNWPAVLKNRTKWRLGCTIIWRK